MHTSGEDSLKYNHSASTKLSKSINLLFLKKAQGFWTFFNDYLSFCLTCILLAHDIIFVNLLDCRINEASISIVGIALWLIHLS